MCHLSQWHFLSSSEGGSLAYRRNKLADPRPSPYLVTHKVVVFSTKQLTLPMGHLMMPTAANMLEVPLVSAPRWLPSELTSAQESHPACLTPSCNRHLDPMRWMSIPVLETRKTRQKTPITRKHYTVVLFCICFFVLFCFTFPLALQIMKAI